MLLGAAIASASIGVKAQTTNRSDERKVSKSDSGYGKKTFASTCAVCHGLDGKGGERAPNIADRPNVQRLSDAELFSIVQNGIPETGMPAFHAMQRFQIRAVVAYLRGLQGKDGAVKLPGDSQRGREFFFGKAGCSGCHMIKGKGGFIASDLSAYAASHGADRIRSAILRGGPGGDRQVRLITVTLRNGEKYVGRIRNEDNFTVQLQSLDGAFTFWGDPISRPWNTASSR